MSELETVIAPAIAQGLGASQDDPGTQLVTASLTTAFHLLADQQTCEAARWTATEADAQVDQVFTFLRGRLEALRQARGVQAGSVAK